MLGSVAEKGRVVANARDGNCEVEEIWAVDWSSLRRTRREQDEQRDFIAIVTGTLPV